MQTIAPALNACPHCRMSLPHGIPSCPYCGLIFAKWRLLRVRRLEEILARSTGAHKLGLSTPPPPSRYTFKRKVALACLVMAALHWYRPLLGHRAAIIAYGQTDGLAIYAARAQWGSYFKAGMPNGIELRDSYMGIASGGSFGPRIVINMDSIGQQVDWICSTKKQWAQNDEYLRSGDSRWRQDLQGISKTFAGVPRWLLRDKVLKTEFESTVRHECKHAKDEGWNLSGSDAEARAYLAEMMTSTLVLMRLRQYPPILAPNQAGEPHHVAANRIWLGLLEFPDIHGDRRNVYRLSPEELGRRARMLYENWYGPYAPPDEACLNALPFKDVL